MSVFKILCK